MIKNKITLVILTFILIVIFLSNNSLGVASISASKDSLSIKEGENATITITSTNGTGTISASSNNKNISVSIGENWIESGKSITLSIKGNSAGDSVISISGILSDETSEDAKEYNINKQISVHIDKKIETTNNTITPNTATVTNTTNANTSTSTSSSTQVTNNSKPTETKPVETKKSSNANIAALWLTPKEYDFTGSKASVLTYNTKVPYEVEEITIGGRTQDSKAKFTSGIGKQKLQVGNNSVKVEVTAEDGSKKTYTINITREEKKVEEQNKLEDTNTVTEEVNTTKLENTVDINKEADLLKLEVKGFKFTPDFSPNIYEYKMNVDNTTDSLDVITEKKDNNVSIEIVGNTELKEGENVITILVHNNSTNKDYTYQIIVDKLAKIDLKGLNENLNKETQTANNNRKIIFGLGIGIIIVLIIFIIVKSLSSYNEEEDDDDEQKNDDDNDEKINLEEDEKLFKRIDKKEKNEKEEEEEEEVVSSPKQRKKGKHF